MIERHTCLTGALRILISHALRSSRLLYLAHIYYERFFTRNLLSLKGMIHIFSILRFFIFINYAINLESSPLISSL